MLVLALISIATGLAPLYVIRLAISNFPVIDALPTTLLEIVILVTVFVWLCKKLTQSPVDVLNLFKKYLSPSILLFLFAAIASVIVSPDKRGALGVFKAYIVEPILLYIIIIDTIKKQNDWRWVFRAVMFSGVLVAGLAVAQHTLNYLPTSSNLYKILRNSIIFAPYEAKQDRVHAFYNTANAVGLYIGPLLALSFSQVKRPFSERVWFKDVGWIALTGFYLVAIVLSRSAGALVASTVVLLFLPLIRYDPVLLKKLAKALLIAVLVISILLPVVGSYINPKEVVADDRYTNNTIRLRFCLWEGAGKLLLDRPLTGAGLSGFKEQYSNIYYTCDSEPLEYPHNILLNAWTELGFLGAVSFFVIIWQLMNKRLSLQESWKPYLPLILALVYMLVHGLVDVPYFKNDLSLQFWIIAALIEAKGKTK